jgi:hypothetical protein
MTLPVESRTVPFTDAVESCPNAAFGNIAARQINVSHSTTDTVDLDIFPSRS